MSDESELAKAARRLLADLATQRTFWIDEAMRTNDTYTLVHRDLYDYLARRNPHVDAVARALAATKTTAEERA